LFTREEESFTGIYKELSAVSGRDVGALVWGRLGHRGEALGAHGTTACHEQVNTDTTCMGVTQNSLSDKQCYI